METLEIKTGDMPTGRGSSLANKVYANTAASMEVGQYVETQDRKTTAGLLRALERLDRLGRQRKVDGTLCVWRIK